MIIVIFYYMPALVFFVFLGAWHFFISDMLEPIYESIHEKIGRQNRMKQFLASLSFTDL